MSLERRHRWLVFTIEWIELSGIRHNHHFRARSLVEAGAQSRTNMRPERVNEFETGDVRV
jgi:hypothetical protein